MQARTCSAPPKPSLRASPVHADASSLFPPSTLRHPGKVQNGATSHASRPFCVLLFKKTHQSYEDDPPMRSCQSVLSGPGSHAFSHKQRRSKSRQADSKTTVLSQRVFCVFVLFSIISQYYIIKRMLYSKHDSSVSHCTGGVEEHILKEKICKQFSCHVRMTQPSV